MLATTLSSFAYTAVKPGVGLLAAYLSHIAAISAW